MPEPEWALLRAVLWMAAAGLGACLECVRGRAPAGWAAVALVAGLGVSAARASAFGPVGNVLTSLFAAGVAGGLFYVFKRLGAVTDEVPLWAAALAAFAVDARLASAVLLYGAFCGLPLGLIALARARTPGVNWKTALWNGLRFRYDGDDDAPARVHVPYVTALACGVALALWRYGS